MVQPSRPRWMLIGALILSGASSCHASIKQEAKVNKMGVEEPAAVRADAPIGTATQEADGTIVLQLRAEQEAGGMGDAQFRYTPTDKDYAMIARHVGPIPRGGSVPVRPFTRQ